MAFLGTPVGQLFEGFRNQGKGAMLPQSPPIPQVMSPTHGQNQLPQGPPPAGGDRGEGSGTQTPVHQTWFMLADIIRLRRGDMEAKRKELPLNNGNGQTLDTISKLYTKSLLKFPKFCVLSSQFGRPKLWTITSKKRMRTTGPMYDWYGMTPLQSFYSAILAGNLSFFKQMLFTIFL